MAYHPPKWIEWTRYRVFSIQSFQMTSDTITDHFTKPLTQIKNTTNTVMG